ncbi:MAG: hypothetical protein AAF532_05510 [Planctomycetota bacterium]
MKELFEFLAAIAWPVTVLIIAYNFRGEFRKLLRRLSSAKFGGGEFEFGENVEEAKRQAQKLVEPVEAQFSALTAKTTAVTTQAARDALTKMGLEPSPSGLDLSVYRKVAEADASHAVSCVEYELAVAGRNLARRYGLAFDKSTTATQIYQGLVDKAAISYRQFRLIKALLKSGEAAAGGAFVSQRAAEEVIEMADDLLKYYKNWLGDGAKDTVEPR